MAEKAQGTAENAEFQESIRLSDRYASTIKFLQGFNAELQEQEGDVARGEKGLEEVEALQLEKTQLQHQLQVCYKERGALEVWGDFDPASVMRLQEVGYQVNFYICSEKHFNEEWLDVYKRQLHRLSSLDKLRMRISFTSGVRAWVLRSVPERRRIRTTC